MTGEEDAHDFVWCDVRWNGPGGIYDLGEGVVQNHVCSQHDPSHTVHICCCLAVKPEEIHETGPNQVVVSP